MIKRFSKATRTKQEQTQIAQQQDAPPSSRASRQRKKTAVLAMLVSLAILASVLLFFTHGTTKGTKLAGGHQYVTPTPIATLPIMPVRLNTGWVKRWAYPQFLISNGHKAVPLPFITEVEVTSSPSEQGVVYLCPPAYFDASYRATQDSQYLYRSNDAGKTWTRLPLPAGVVGCLLRADPVMAGRIVIKDPVHYQVYLSSDHGSSWQHIVSPVPIRDETSILPVAARLYLDGYWSADFQHWKRWAPAVPLGDPYQVVVGSEPPYPIYTMFSGKCFNLPPGANGGFIPNLCRSDDGGHSWHFLISLQGDGPVEGAFCLVPTNPTHLFAWGSASHQDIQSVDGGATWTPLPGPLGLSNLICETSRNFLLAWGDESLIEQQTHLGLPLQIINQAITSSGFPYQASFEKTQINAEDYTIRGVSFWKDNRWQVIAPPPFKDKTAAGKEPRILLITPKSGPPHLYAYTGTDLYEYTGPFTLN